MQIIGYSNTRTSSAVNRKKMAKATPLRILTIKIMKRNDAEQRFDIREKLINSHQLAQASHFDFK